MPSSHGSLDGDGDGDPPNPDNVTHGHLEEDDDGFDSEEFRTWLREKEKRKSSDRRWWPWRRSQGFWRRSTSGVGWYFGTIPGLADQGSALVSNHACEGTRPRPDDPPEAWWSALSVLQAPGEGPQVVGWWAGWSQAFSSNGHPGVLWRRHGGGATGSVGEGDLPSTKWNVKEGAIPVQDEPWCGQTIFFRKTRVTDEVIKDKFTQQEKLASQGGYITFFYDSKMETEEAAYPITVICWKSFRIRRCTVNTLSAECQAMIQGVGSLHWLRFLVQEAFGKDIDNQNWERAISAMPCIAVTDSKSLYDTIHRCCNTASHIEDKRTAIDVTILKRDFKQTQGQVR